MKLYAHDIDVIGGWVLRAWRGLMSDPEIVTVVGYGVVALLVMFLGGVVGYMVEENSRLKMLALGMSAPAMLTTLAGGVDATPPPTGPADESAITLPTPGPAGFLDGVIVTTAHAGERGHRVVQLSEGVKLFFGRKSMTQQAPASDERYWVIVGSSTDLEQAKARAEDINRAAPEFEAFVGQPRPDNPNHPIIVGGVDAYLPYDGAMALRERAISAGIAPLDSYLSQYAERVPPADDE